MRVGRARRRRRVSAVDELEYIYIFWKPGVTTYDRRRLTADEWKYWGSRGVWEFPSVRANDDHQAKFPIELPSRVMRLLTDPGDIVLDCFLGSGTTAIACIREDRKYIGIEIEDHYVQLAHELIVAETSAKDAQRVFDANQEEQDGVAALKHAAGGEEQGACL